MSLTKQERRELEILRNKINPLSRKRRKKAKHWKWGKKDTKNAVKKDMIFLCKKLKELKNHPTATEVIFREKLKKLHIKYIFQYLYYYKGCAGICDFYLPDFDLLIEIDGGYHLDFEQKQKDKIKDEICLNFLKKPVLRFSNEQAIKIDSDMLQSHLAQFMSRLSRRGKTG